MADGGFKGEPQFVVTPWPRNALTPARRRFNRRISAERWRVEAAFSRLKRWRVLECKYRHSLKERRLVWKVVVALYNIDVVLHPLSA